MEIDANTSKRVKVWVDLLISLLFFEGGLMPIVEIIVLIACIIAVGAACYDICDSVKRINKR